MANWKYSGNKILSTGAGGFSIDAAVLTWPAYTGGFAPASLVGVDQIPVAGTVYFAPICLPYSMTVSKIGYNIGSVGGTDLAIASLYTAGGTLIQSSLIAGTTVGTTATMQELALLSTVDLPMGIYLIGVSVNGTTCRLSKGVANGNRGGSAAGSFGVLATLTPAITNVAGIIAYLI